MKFYSHLISYESIFVELEELDLSPSEKENLASLIDSSIHHSILEAVFSHLTESDKKKLLEHIYSQDHDKIWQLLKSKVGNIEGVIKKAAKDLKRTLHEDIKEAKNLKKK